jgi:hypothetical protein
MYIYVMNVTIIISKIATKSDAEDRKPTKTPTVDVTRDESEWD